MKMYTTPEQTAKLKELGFEKPKSVRYPKDERESERVNTTDFLISDYSIGELIEMLPEAVCLSSDDSVHYLLEIYTDSLYWYVAYKEGPYEAYSVESDELIDALYYTVARLKDEGVI